MRFAPDFCLFEQSIVPIHAHDSDRPPTRSWFACGTMTSVSETAKNASGPRAAQSAAKWFQRIQRLGSYNLHLGAIAARMSS
jgi:hypothetical protein